MKNNSTILRYSLGKKSHEPIFGNYLSIDGIIEATLVTKSNDRYQRTAPDTCIVDFVKFPQIVQYSIDDIRRNTTLDSLVDKKILFNRNNLSTSQEADEMMKSATYESCLRLFDCIEIPIDLHKTNSDIELVISDNFEPFTVKVYPILDRFTLGNEMIKELTDRHILWGICDRDHSYLKKDLDKDCSYVKNKNNDLYYKINCEHVDDKGYRDRLAADILGNWDKYKVGIDTSGSLKNKREVIKYLRMGGGFIPVSNSNMKSLSENNTSKVFKFRDARYTDEKFAQKINTGTSKKKFVKEENKDSIVVGYSDSFIESCLNSVE